MDIKYKLVDYFARMAPLSEEERNAIADSIKTATYEKGTILLKEGQVATECYFVLEGCVRQYYIVDGEERTNNFFTEEQWVASLDSFIHQTPADHFLGCCERTTLVVGNEQKENDLYARFPRFETISRKVLEKVFAEQQQLMAAYYTDTPEQRYMRLLNTRPGLLQRVPQYQLASYIGVKPESLSRIRKRIASKSSFLLNGG